MKIVDHAGLMTMPRGTIFQELRNGMSLGDPMIFGGPTGVGGDYTEAGLLPHANHLDVHGYHLPGIRHKFVVPEDGYGVWYPSGFGRDGMYDASRHYLIWERKDRERIASWILDPDRAWAEQNDDPHALIQIPKVLIEGSKK